MSETTRSLKTLTKDIGGCTYFADVTDWVSWGGDPTMWGIILRELGVDGTVWRCPHAAIAEDEAGHSRCIFHLTPEEVPNAEDKARELRDVLMASTSASEAWARRLNQFIGATFRTLMLHCPLSETTGDQPLYLIGASVAENLTISGPIRQRFVGTLAKFDGRTDFSNATFEREADFQKTKFGQDVDVQQTTFSREADFREATFEDKVNFTNATFKGKVNFRMTTFQDMVSFENVSFERSLDFSDARFKRKPNFKNTIFQDGCECGRDKISGPCLD